MIRYIDGRSHQNQQVTRYLNGPTPTLISPTEEDRKRRSNLVYEHYYQAIKCISMQIKDPVWPYIKGGGKARRAVENVGVCELCGC